MCFVITCFPVDDVIIFLSNLFPNDKIGQNLNILRTERGYTHREKAPSNKIPALTKSINMHIWVVGTSSEPFLRSS